MLYRLTILADAIRIRQHMGLHFNTEIKQVPNGSYPFKVFRGHRGWLANSENFESPCPWHRVQARRCSDNRRWPLKRWNSTPGRKA